MNQRGRSLYAKGPEGGGEGGGGKRDESGRLDDQWTTVEIPNTNKSQFHNELRPVRIKYTILNVEDKHTF